MQERFKRIILPTPLQAVGCFVFSAAIFISVYQSVLVPRFYQKVSVGAEDVNQAGTGVLVQLNQFSVVRTAVEVGFWALVGIGCYIVYLAITNAIIEARNEVVIDTEYTNRGAFAQHMRRYGYQLLAAVGLMALLVIASRWLLPLWFQLADHLFFSGISAANAVLALVGFMGMCLTIYLVWMGIELTFAADQL